MIDKNKVNTAVMAIGGLLGTLDLTKMEELTALSEAIRYELKTIDLMCEIREKSPDEKFDAITELIENAFKKFDDESGD